MGYTTGERNLRDAFWGISLGLLVGAFTCAVYNPGDDFYRWQLETIITEGAVGLGLTIALVASHRSR